MAKIHAAWARRGDETVHPAIDLRATVYAGLVGGAVFLALELIMVPLLLGESMWGPPRMIAAIVLGESALPPPATFSAGIVAIAMLVHFALSIVYTLIASLLIYRWSSGAAVSVGLLYGLALYVVNFYGFTEVFPWFAMARNWVSIFAHLVFGVVTAWSYKGLSKLN